MMSSSYQNEDTKVKLASSMDWNSWKYLFEMKAYSAGLWEKIDPDNDDAPAFLTKPKAPDLLVLLESPGTQTRASSATDNAMAVTVTEVDKYCLRLYEINIREFQNERKEVSKLRDWVVGSVDLILCQTYCRPTESLKKWYSSLKESVGMDLNLAKAEANLAFNRFMMPPKRPPKDILKWVSDFEKIMMVSQALGIPTAMESTCWYLALHEAAKPFLGLRLNIWKIQFAQEIINNTLTYQKVANMIRFEVLIDPTLNKGVKRAGFAAVTAEDISDQPTSDNEPTDEADGPALKRRKKNQQRHLQQVNPLWP